MSSRIEQLRSLGQSVWLDFIRRGHLVSGEFERLIEIGVAGVTSNPTIFHQAITESDDYDAALHELVPKGLKAVELFDALAIEDIQMACDRLRPVYERTGGLDGRVSIEVNPRLAHDTRGTIEEARRLHQAVGRDNLMVKIPATLEGLPAIATCLAEGICINVTLTFSLARYEQVMDAYLSGLEQRAAKSLPLQPMVSVASFFVSRVDTKVDKAIDEAVKELPEGTPARAELESLKGQAAVANARLAYARFKQVFSSPRFEVLRARGARVQRPLWASTSTKNPAYRDTLYVDELIGPDTVNTMPPQTLAVFNDHGVVEARVERDLDRARELFERLPRHGIPAEALIAQLEPEGVTAFARSYDALIEALEKRRRAILGRPRVSPKIAPSAVTRATHARLAQLERESFIRRLWARDETLWSGDPVHQHVARTRLGWLDAPLEMTAEIASLKAFAGQISSEGFTRAVLLGMGGSSLAPEVLSRTFGVGQRGLELTVLDSTSPAAVRAVGESHDPGTTLFVVSSKTGTTLEVLSLEKHFFEWARRARADAGRGFVAVTDPDTPLEALARTRGYRRVFTNRPDIGGRYSALSYFGLVPAALIGMDLTALLEHALDEARACGPDSVGVENFGVELGAALGELALRGRDKVTFVPGPEFEAFGDWAEQLLAESTGKDARGLVPVTGEALAPPDRYGNDRVFVAFSVNDLPRETETLLEQLEGAGHAVLRWRDPEPAALGAEFVRWEIATATIGAVIGVDPFDEPNVTEAKQATQAALERFLKDGRFAARPRLAESKGIAVEAPQAIGDLLAPRVNGRDDPAAWLTALLGLARPGDYFALLGYFRRTPQLHERLQRLRTAAGRVTKLATTLGYGPRFLHSTGQLHKGGPNTGIFLQFTADEGEDVPIPGENFTFGSLIRSQADGDYEVLERRGRRLMRIHLGGEPEKALEELSEALAAARV